MRPKSRPAGNDNTLLHRCADVHNQDIGDAARLGAAHQAEQRSGIRYGGVGRVGGIAEIQTGSNHLPRASPPAEQAVLVR
jgi:hypothetical protein